MSWLVLFYLSFIIFVPRNRFFFIYFIHLSVNINITISFVFVLILIFLLLVLFLRLILPPIPLHPYSLPLRSPLPPSLLLHFLLLWSPLNIPSFPILFLLQLLIFLLSYFSNLPFLLALPSFLPISSLTFPILPNPSSLPILSSPSSLVILLSLLLFFNFLGFLILLSFVPFSLFLSFLILSLVWFPPSPFLSTPPVPVPSRHNSSLPFTPVFASIPVLLLRSSRPL